MYNIIELKFTWKIVHDYGTKNLHDYGTWVYVSKDEINRIRS